MITTHNGIFFDNIVEENSYMFIQNEKNTMNEEIEVTDQYGNPIYDEDNNIVKKSTGIVHSFYFWMQNRLQYYERNYERLQDILSDIGGIREIIYLIAAFINALYSYYTILFDTEEIIFTIENNNEKDKSSLNNKGKVNEILNPPKVQKAYVNNNTKQVSNMQRLIKDDINIYGDINIFNKNNNNLFENKNDDNNINEKNNEENTKREGENLNLKIKRIKRRKSSKIKIKTEERKKSNDSNKLISERTKENKTNQIPKRNISLLKFIKYLFYCKKRDVNISYIEEYRQKIVSEESIIQDYLDLILIRSLYKQKEYNVNNMGKENLNINYDCNNLQQSNSG